MSIQYIASPLRNFFNSQLAYLVGFLVLVLSHAPTTQAAEKLTLLNWEAYLSDQVIALWQQETGIEIEQIYFDNDEKRDQIISQREDYQVDLVVVDEIATRTFGERGTLLELNSQLVPNIEHIRPRWREQCSEFGVPYMWGTFGISYRTDKLRSPPQSWKDLLQPEPALKGHIGMMDDYTDMLSPALFYLGYPIDTESEDHLKMAFQLLKQQAIDVLTYDYAITFLQVSPKAERLYMALTYSGDHHTLNEIVGKEGLWEYIVPKEGTVLWVDCLSVSNHSPNKALALQFLNFINRPDIAALNAEGIQFATANQSALKYLPAAVLEDATLYPSEEVIQRSSLYTKLSDENVMLRQRINNAVMQHHDTQ